MRYFRSAFFLLGLSAFFFFLRAVSVAQIVSVARAIDWRFAVFAFVSYLGVNVLRVERLHPMLDMKVSRRDLYGLIFLQNFFNAFFSFSGDALYVSLLHRQKAVSLGENIASLAGVKIFDFIALAGMFAGAVLLGGAGFFFLRPAAWILIALAVAAAAAAARPQFAVAFATRCADALGMAEWRSARLFLEKLRDAAERMEFLDRRGLAAKIIIFTFANWGLTFLSGFLLLRGAGIAVAFGQAVFAYSFPIAASLTPFHVFGGFGSYEASLVGGLILVGIARNTAIAISILLHVQELGFVIALAGAGYFLYRWRVVEKAR